MTDLILDAIARAGYLGIFLLMALENVIPPIPSEVIMGLGGMAVARGDMALVPLIGFWFGYSTMPRVIVCVIISLFPIIVNTLFGLQSADQGMHDLFTLQHASRMTRLRTLMFPAAMPAIFAGLRISAGLAVIGAIVGDFFFGQGTPGLGQVLKRATGNNESELLIATVIVACLLGVAVFLFFGWLSRRVTSRWHSTTGAG